MLTERRERLLRFIVDEYVRTAQPVASNSVVQRTGLPVSSATIRNEMARLEDEGYIVQPHTSAGRMPTDKGYRYYVEALMRPQEPPAAVQQTIRHQFHQAAGEAADWAHLAAAALAVRPRYGPRPPGDAGRPAHADAGPPALPGRAERCRRAPQFPLRRTHRGRDPLPPDRAPLAGGGGRALRPRLDAVAGRRVVRRGLPGGAAGDAQRAGVRRGRPHPGADGAAGPRQPRPGDTDRPGRRQGG